MDATIKNEIKKITKRNKNAGPRSTKAIINQVGRILHNNPPTVAETRENFKKNLFK